MGRFGSARGEWNLRGCDGQRREDSQATLEDIGHRSHLVTVGDVATDALACYTQTAMKQYRLTAVIWKEGKRYVSRCPELGVASHGASPEKAHAALAEAVGLYLSNAKRFGLLADIEPTLVSKTRYASPLEIFVA